jgi:CDP-diacylglycerol--serine O-phosphatidyltransferase
VVIGLVMLDPYRVPFVVLFIYCLHGPILSLWQSRRLAQYRQKRREKRGSIKAGKSDKESE